MIEAVFWQDICVEDKAMTRIQITKRTLQPRVGICSSVANKYFQYFPTLAISHFSSAKRDHVQTWVNTANNHAFEPSVDGVNLWLNSPTDPCKSLSCCAGLWSQHSVSNRDNLPSVQRWPRPAGKSTLRTTS